MQSNNASTMSKFIKTKEWIVNSNRYMQPRLTDKGIKMVSIISNQRNKKLHLQLPLMTCWGIEDFTDKETGESDGKFKIKLHFRDDGSDESKEAIAKLQAFEESIISDAVSNSEAWFGKKLSRELAEDRYFNFIKVGKNKETKEPDPTRGYYFSPKVNCYNNKWDLEIFDSSNKLVFPSEDESLTPMDFVPAGSEVTCGLECKYIWLGAKGWGVSWALKQCVVTPKITDSVIGKLQLEVPSDSHVAAESYVVPPPHESHVVVPPTAVSPAQQRVDEIPSKVVVPAENYAEDSDAENVPVAEDEKPGVEETVVADDAIPEVAVAPPAAKIVVRRTVPTADGEAPKKKAIKKK